MKFFDKICFLLIFSVFLSTSVSALELTSEETAWLNEHGRVIRFVSQKGYAPLEFVNERGISSGANLDVARWLAAELGIAISFSHATLEEALAGVADGTYDAITGLFETAERSELFSFTPGFFRVPGSIFVRTARSDVQDLNDLKSKTIAMQSGAYAAEFLRQKGLSYVPLVTEDFGGAVDAVVSGRADAMIGNEQIMFNNLYTAGLIDEVKKVGAPVYVRECAMAVSKTNAVLLSILSKGIHEALHEGVVDQVGHHWFGMEHTAVGFQMVRYIHYVAIAFGLLFVAVLIFWIWDIRMARRVARKTEELRQSEERLRTIFQHSPDAIQIQDREGKILDANPAACSFHGMTYEELVGSNALQLVPEGERETVRQNFSKMLSGEMERYEGHLYAAGRRTVPVEVIGAPMRYDGQNVVLFHIRDMTEHKRSELALRESEMRYRGLIETQSNLIVRIDAEGRFTFANEAFCRFVGRSLSELLGRNCSPYIHHEDVPIAARSLNQLIGRREKSVATEYRMRARTYVAWVHWEKIAVLDEDGHVIEIQSVGQDITARRRIDKALQESEKRLNFLFEEIPHVAVQGYNSKREAIFWNRASEELFGYSKADVIGKKIEELVWPADRKEEIRRAFDAWVKSGEAIPSGEMMKQTADNRQVAVYSSRLATRNQRGEWEMYVVDLDLSEIKRANHALLEAKEAAEKANRAKSEFLANMSHEIRTPMNGVMGMTHLLRETDLTAEQRDSVDTIMESTQELITIIDELLDISRMEAGEVRLQPEPFSPRETADKVVALFADRAGRKGLNVLLAAEKDVPVMMKGDAGRIRQILINLVGNAMKFTHEGYIRVHLSARHDAGNCFLKIAVVDTGIGIPAEFQQKVFDKFTQNDTSSKRLYGGAGLGLAITRQLVELMGGTISVESREGRGTTFRLEVKLEALAETDEVESAPQADRGGLPEIDADVLLVEDNLVNQKVATAMIRKFGCRVTVAPNGARALEKLPVQKFDLIFMDCQMPIMDGFETTRAIRQMVGTIRDIPIVAMTAHALKEDRQRCLDAGMDDYLSKPVHRDALAAVLKKYCG